MERHFEDEREEGKPRLAAWKGTSDYGDGGRQCESE